MRQLFEEPSYLPNPIWTNIFCRIYKSFTNADYPWTHINTLH